MRARGRAQGKRAFKSLARSVFFVIAFFLFPVTLGVAVGGYWAFTKTVPSVADLKKEISLPSTRIYADDESLIGEIKIRRGRDIPLKKMPPELINAVISVEDEHFWRHGGIDYAAIMRAAAKDLMNRHLKEGGSTITQQLAKNAFLTSEKTFKRKLKELVLAQRIEESLTKEEILELYLNRAYFGEGAYGVEMAAVEYFGKESRDLTLPEAAMIAGLLKAPSTFSPKKGFERAKERQKVVLRRMEESGYISKRQRIEAEDAVLVLHRAEPAETSAQYFIDFVKKELVKTYGEDEIYHSGLNVYTTLNLRAQAAAQEAVQIGLRDLDKRRGWRGPVGRVDLKKANDSKNSGKMKNTMPRVGDTLTATVLEVKNDSARLKADMTTGTLDLKDSLWAAARRVPGKEDPVRVKVFTLRKILSPGDRILVLVKSVRASGEAEFALEQEPEAQATLVAMEPHTGYLRAIVGGYDFAKSEYNRALYAKRQAGSAFKPIIYAVALNYGYTPASVIEDEEVTYDDPEDEEAAEAAARRRRRPAAEDEEEVRPWSPQNYDEEFKGATTLRDALAYSRNIVTVKVADSLGIQRIIDFTRQIGIEGDIPRDLTISLGSLCLSPLDLTVTYGVFANGGIRVEPIAIRYVTNSRGRLLDSFKTSERRVMDPGTAFLITSMMKDVVRYGTGWRARELKRPVAGKTGTTNEYRDAWFIGFTTDMVAGVWVGLDDMKTLGKDETGSRAAAPIWVDFMKRTAMDSEPRDFPRPEGIVTRTIDPKTGLLANKWTEGATVEYFKEGTEPMEQSPSIWQTKEPENLLF